MQPIALKTIEIRWHWKASVVAADEKTSSKSSKGGNNQHEAVTVEGILAVDYHPTKERICTAGLDGSVKIWDVPQQHLKDLVHQDQFDISKACDFISYLKIEAAHGPPNAARWSPCGNFIASCHDNGGLTLWFRDTAAEERGVQNTNAESENAFNKEQWAAARSFGGHLVDIVDIAFSPDSKYLISGGVDGNVIVHSVQSGSQVWKSQDEPTHKNACQGVSWDPWNRFTITAGADKMVFVQSVNPPTANRRFTLSHQRKVHDREAGVKFQGEGAVSFFRRMCWSPDGTLLVVPCGINEKGDADSRHCVYVFMRNQLEKPVIRLTVKGKDTILGAKWCPCYFDPHEDDSQTMHQRSKGMWGNPNYRMALAIWTEDAVYVYTTDAAARYCHLTDLHLDSITDVTWSPKGDFLFVSALDGYITTCNFTQPIGVAHTSLKEIAQDDATAFPQKVKDELKEESEKAEKEILESFTMTKKVVAPVRKKKKKEEEKKVVVEKKPEVKEADADALGAIFDV